MPLNNLTPKEIATEAVRRIETHPSTWNQRWWVCASGMCFAGHVAIVAGADYPNIFRLVGMNWYVSRETGRQCGTTGTHVKDFAGTALNIGPESKMRLFRPDATIDDIKRELGYLGLLD